MGDAKPLTEEELGAVRGEVTRGLHDGDSWARVQRLLATIDALRAELAPVRADRAQLMARRDELEAEVDALRLRVAEVENVMVLQAVELARAKEVRARAETSASGYMRRVTALEAELAAERERRETLEDDRRRALKKMDELTLDTQTCEEGATALVSSCRATRVALERSEAEVARLTAYATHPDREGLGREVRRVWIQWAREQPSPKASWLLEWDELSEPDREVDCRIGERIHAIAFAGSVLHTPDALRGGDRG